MKSLATAISLSLLAVSHAAWSAIDIKGVHFNDTVSVAGQTLVLNGAGTRVRFVIDVYVAALYVARKEALPQSLISQSGAKSVQITLLRDLQGEDFADALIKGLRKNSSDAELSRFEPKIDELKSLMLEFGSVKKGTSIRLDLIPGTGTQIFVNGSQRGKTITGDEFYTALLRIWLGNQAVDNDLKAGLIGAK